MKTKKTAFYVLLTYIIMQLSVFLFFPPIVSYLKKNPPADLNKVYAIIRGWWMFGSMLIGLIICTLFIRTDKSFWSIFKGEKATSFQAITWGIIGFFLVFFGQSFGAWIESTLGIQAGSENTANLVSIADVAPISIFAIVIFGPILEEFVFRRVIFGSLLQTTNFFIAASVSAIVFAIIHMDFTHIILYAISGFIFAYLYYRTKRIMTSIIAHMMLNGFVTVVQLYREPILHWMEQNSF